MKRILSVFRARNLEFIRDRSALGWNIVFPVLLVFGFAFMFGNESREVFKAGVWPAAALDEAKSEFLQLDYVQFVAIDDLDRAVNKVRHHQLDMVLALDEQTRYWINSDSANGYFLEKLLLGAASDGEPARRETVEGREIRYVDWALPGILAVTMMFSCLYGIGYVIVRYRKNRVLRRLKATPLGVWEFLLAQVSSRLFIVMITTAVVYFGCDLFVGFFMQGSVFDLFVVFALGTMSLISMGLVVASRVRSEELSDGILNLISWPMMLLSEVWFSLEGASEFARTLSELFPLTYMIRAARAIMNDGATLADVAQPLGILVVMTVFFLVLGTLLFRWE